jgi:hypothetical protein
MRVTFISSTWALAALAFAAATLGCTAQVTITESEPPRSLPDLDAGDADPRRVVQISGDGANTCARRAEGSVACWGEVFGAAPQEIDGVSSAVDVRVGAAFACALQADAHVDCWSLPWTGGAGGPAPVPGLTDAVQLSVGSDHACAVRAGGGAVCWGSNFAGALGDGTLIDRAEPVPVVGLGPVVEIAAGFSSTCARLGNGGARCWGRDLSGQLGDGQVTHPQCNETTMCSTTPVVVAALDDAAEISAGLNGAGARRTDGHVVGWGWNSSGEIGDGTQQDRAEPAPALEIADAKRIYVGYQRRCAIRAGGELACWGAPTDTTSGAQPVLTATKIEGLDEVVDVTGGWYHLCALDRGGRVSCWGDNQWYQLGDGTMTRRDAPVPVVGL